MKYIKVSNNFQKPEWFEVLEHDIEALYQTCQNELSSIGMRRLQYLISNESLIDRLEEFNTRIGHDEQIIINVLENIF